jgi:hypothetical protein
MVAKTTRGCGAHELRARAFKLEAEAKLLHAEAALLDAKDATATSTREAWIPLSDVQLARKSARAIVRSGAVASRKVNGRIYVSASSFDAFMRQREVPSNDDDDLRAELGLVQQRAS